MGEADDEMPQVDAAERDDATNLIRAAAAGDKRAAGEYFTRNLQRLSAAARQIAGTSADPGDLLGDALLVVLTKWTEGTGPTGNVNAYISKIMKNRLLDELKSPRSRVQAIDLDHDPEAPEDARIRRIELEKELALIRRALSELPPDQREVLIATIIEGQKPRDLEERLGRPASAIYPLTNRAKDNLLRRVLQILLTDDARPECIRAAKHLPRKVDVSPERMSEVGSVAHYRTCRRCRRVWARFGAMSTLGLVPLLVVNDILNAPPSSASVASSSSDTTRRTPSKSPPANTQAPPRTAMLPNPPPARVGPARRIIDWTLDLAGPMVVVCGLAVVGVLGAALLTSTRWFAAEPTANINVEATADAEATELALRFEVIEETWHTRSLQLVLSERIRAIEPPHGWKCTSNGPVATCATDEKNAHGGTFHFTHPGTQMARSYQLTLTATTESGDTVVGTASGSVEP